MPLGEYHQKRDFKKTVEPRGKITKSSAGNLYIIQKHDATRLHYDFRLELDGVLLSWAIPKGPSYDPHDKRLAVHVEDHPIDYGDFEGIIPEGQYGGGTVMLWDRGTWKPLGDAREMLQKGALKFELHGEKLKGKWTLIRMGGWSNQRGDNEKENWLLIKEKDEFVRPGGEYDVTVAKPKSVATGRTMEQIAEKQDRVWGSNRGAKTKEPKVVGLKLPAKKTAIAKKTRTASAKTAGVKKKISETSEPEERQELVKVLSQTGARKAPMPEEFQCELATLVEAAPTDVQWIHEIKYDGYRMLCRIERGKARLISRNGKDWSEKFPKLVEAAEQFGLRSGILDGEVVVLTPEGLSKFSDMPRAFKGRTTAEFTYFFFDMPFCEGFDLRGLPLLQRKELLQRVLAAADQPALRYSDHIIAQGATVYENACRLGMEGIICKQAQSKYIGARTKHWLKVKCAKRQEFVIGGYSEPGGARKGFGALLLGVYDGDKLLYSGRVGTGFNDELLDSMYKKMERLEQPKPTFVNPPRGYEAKGVHWIRPELVCEVSFTEWLDDHSPRHPSFQGLREDKQPRQVQRERVQSTAHNTAEEPPMNLDSVQSLSGSKKVKKSGTRKKHGTAYSDEAVFSGVKLSHPDKVLFPDQNVTKRQLAEYYMAVADVMLPHVVRRPLSLVRCPQGYSEKCFFQKHLKDSMPPTLRGIEIKETGDPETYILADGIEGIISLAQMGVLEIHPWGSTEEHIEQPDRVVMDFDPDEGLDWNSVIEAVRQMKSLLDDLGLQSWLKTSGGKGWHVVIPLTPKANWDEVKAFARALADFMVREAPDKYIATMSKARRKGKIFIDYLRNSRGATSVAPYSTRARPGAPVSAPIFWEELKPTLRADQFNIENMPQRLTELKRDPWTDIGKARQSITAAIRKKLSL